MSEVGYMAHRNEYSNYDNKSTNCYSNYASNAAKQNM